MVVVLLRVIWVKCLYLIRGISDRPIVAIPASGGEIYLSTAMFEIPELISLEMSY